MSAFKRMSVSTLATLAGGYAGEEFRFVGERAGPQNTHLVDTELIKEDKSTVDLTYVMRKLDSRWMILDVVVEQGISELAVRRSEYRLVLKEKGVEGLIDALNRKADELMASK